MKTRDAQWVAGLCVLAAVLRFSTLGVQSFGEDEAFTVLLSRDSFGGLGDRLLLESTPPLYFVLVWVWGQVFGTDEAGLRSLSALCGTLAVPAVWWAGRALLERRAALIAAAIFAVNPLLVWYGQEARSYALVVLLATVGFGFFARALGDENRSRALAGWAVMSALALCTHYFALFVVVPEAAWLVARVRPRRLAVFAAAVPAATLAALYPLVHDQRNPSTGWTRKWTIPDDEPLLDRVVQIPREALAGYAAPAGRVFATVLGLLVLFGLVLLVTRATPAQRRGAGIAATVAATALAIPIGAALTGSDSDYVLTRFFLAAGAPCALIVAAGLAATRGGRLAAVALCALSLPLVVAVAADSRYQRPDIGGAVRSIDEGAPPRAVLVIGRARQYVEAYLPGVRDFPSAGAGVSEVDIVILPLPGRTRPPRFVTPRPPPGFALAQRTVTHTYATLRYRPATARLLTTDDVTNALVDLPAALRRRVSHVVLEFPARRAA